MCNQSYQALPGLDAGHQPYVCADVAGKGHAAAAAAGDHTCHVVDHRQQRRHVDIPGQMDETYCEDGLAGFAVLHIACVQIDHWNCGAHHAQDYDFAVPAASAYQHLPGMVVACKHGWCCAVAVALPALLHEHVDRLALCQLSLTENSAAVSLAMASVAQ